MRNSNFTPLVTMIASATAAMLLAGCGMSGGTGTKSNPLTPGGAFAISGKVHGGQQPVGGANINIYAVNVSVVGPSGYGSASISLLKPGVTVTSATDGSGSFTLTNMYTCTPEQRVYVTATGGDAGSGPNGAIALMAAVGRCGDLTSSTFISLNEVTTVASVWALAPFMSGVASIGAPASNITGINNAFLDVNTLASISGGSAGGTSLPAGTTVPVAAINTLADILAACVNTNGTDGACPALFAGAAVGGNAPGDTLTAAMNMAQHPAAGLAMLYPLASPVSPFQPTLKDQPNDFTLAATFSGFTTPTAVAADAGGNVWVTNSSAGKMTELSHVGAAVLTASGLSTPSAVAIDQAGNVWVANSGNASVAKVTNVGAVSTFMGGGLSVPSSIAIDGQGNAWLTNVGNGMVSEFSNSGVALSGSGFPSAGGAPIAVAITPN
jgi:hypothetical protein